MCGRYTFFTDKELQGIDDIIEKISNDIQREKMKTGEIFPTDLVPVLLPEKGNTVPRLSIWGFPNFHNKGVIINARSETLHEKQMFRSALENGRCVIPSTGFYEWDKEKNKYRFNLPDSQMLYLAGLYRKFKGEGRFVILTTNANASMAETHDRMPLVLPQDAVDDWLFHPKTVDDILYASPPMLVRIPAGPFL